MNVRYLMGWMLSVVLLWTISPGAGASSSLLQMRLEFEEIVNDSFITDVSGNGRDAKMAGGPVLTDSGHTGKGMVFDGSDDQLRFAEKTAWGYTDKITVCAWVKITGDGVIIQRGTFIRPIALIVNGSGTVTWAVNTADSGDTRYTSTATVSWDAWHHLAATYSAASESACIYLDGQLIKYGPLTGNLSHSGSTTESWGIGQRNSRTWLKGTLDDVRMYNRDLPADEILSIFNGTESDKDTQAPSVPQNLTATSVSSRQVALAWDASTDNAAVAGYRIYQDGVYLATTHEDSTGYLVYWLTPNTEYTFTVAALDPDTNTSAVSVPAVATTLAEKYPDMYVGGWNINHEMEKISPACMETLRTKHVFGYTKSWGGSMLSGYSRLAGEGSPYILSRADIASPNVVDIAKYNIVKADTTRYPASARIEALGTTLKNWLAPHVDAVFIFWSEMNDSYQGPFNNYSRIFDSLRTAYPDIDFLYTTGGIVGEYELDKINNMNAMMFSEKLQNRYRGEVPIYDMTSLMSVQADDDTSAFWVPYAQYEGSVKSEMKTYAEANDRIANPDSMHVPVTPNSGLHPNAEFEKRLALGMTLMLAKLYCTACFPQDGQTTGVRRSAPLPVSGGSYTVIRSAENVAVRWQGAAAGKLTAYTVSGLRVCGTGTRSGGLISLSTRHLDRGVYLLEFELEGRKHVQRMTVIR